METRLTECRGTSPSSRGQDFAFQSSAAGSIPGCRTKIAQALAPKDQIIKDRKQYCHKNFKMVRIKKSLRNIKAY